MKNSRIGTQRLAVLLPLTLTAASTPRSINLPGARLFPESISITKDKIAYISSMRGGVLRTSVRIGKVVQFIAPGVFGSASLFGVLADPRNRMLWACSNDLSAVGLIVSGGDKASALKGFDLSTGKPRLSLPLNGKRSICNDIAVGKDGAVYVTDTGAPQVLRWRGGAAALETWVTDPALGSADGTGLDGIAIGDDNHIYLNNIRAGTLIRMEITATGRPGKITRLTLSRPLRQPDGMRPIGGMQFALVEGDGKIDRVTVQGNNAKIETLADNIAEPTGVDVVGGIAWYVQGHLSYIFDSAKRSQAPNLPFRVTPVVLAK